jgi:extracellular factor (EF) 3-hydroxypalmitic acid methyl ester biosynthesis protein
MSITAHVCQIASDLRAELADIERQLNQLPEDLAYGRLAAALDSAMARLGELNIWGTENRSYSAELWAIAQHLLQRGWLQDRARTKPRGYAGDYELLARIYDNHLCDDPLGKLFDLYFQDQAAPRAVRHRMQMMRDWIVDRVATLQRRLRLAIVGSAFGLEVRDALRRLDAAVREQVHLTLLDLDPQAIEFARRQLAPLLSPGQLTAESANLFRLPQRPDTASLLDETDMLFCPGMFDYLDDSAAVAMLRTLHERLAPGGALTIFQFAPHNPTRAYMEWVANWYLTYRNESQLRALVAWAGVPDGNLVLGAEPLGLDLFATIVKR